MRPGSVPKDLDEGFVHSWMESADRSPANIEVLAPADKSRLTLVACFPSIMSGKSLPSYRYAEATSLQAAT